MRASRRDLIKVGTLAGAATFVPLSDLLSRAAAAPLPKEPPVHLISTYFIRSTFEARLNDTFTLKGPQGPIRMRLTAVTDVPSAQNAGAVGHQDCFVAVFAGPNSTSLGQNTYQIRNTTLGTFHLFLVPGGGSADARFYVATFNRMTS